jgi:hypothetical protein
MTEAGVHDWQSVLRRVMADVGRPGEDRLGSHTAYPSFIPVRHLLEPARLGDMIRWAGGPDRRATDEATSALDLTIAVSRFARQYCGCVSAIALVGLAHGIGVDVSPEHCAVALTNVDLPVNRRRFVATVDLRADEVLCCAERPTSLPVSGPILATLDELREFVWSRLLGAHYDQLFRQVNAVAKEVSSALLWTSAAEYIAGLSEAARLRLTTESAAPFVADADALLAAETLPGIDGPNPLHGLIVWEPVGKDPHRTVLTRRLCCLNYLLPERDGMQCQNCPYLPAEDREALAAERRGVAVGTAEGPAHRRALEVGRSRPSYQIQRQRMTVRGRG